MDKVLTAVKRDGLSLQEFPEWKEDEEVVLAAVKQNGRALRFTPLRTKNVVLEAVRQNGFAIQYVPESMRDKEMSLEAVHKNGNTILYVPPSIRDKEVVIAAVRQNGKVILDVPEYMSDKEIVLAAVRQNGRVLEHLSDLQRDKDVILAAVEQDGYILEIVPEELRDKDIILAALKNEGSVIELVEKTPEYLAYAKYSDHRIELSPEDDAKAESFLKAKKNELQSIFFMKRKYNDVASNISEFAVHPSLNTIMKRYTRGGKRNKKTRRRYMDARYTTFGGKKQRI